MRNERSDYEEKVKRLEKRIEDLEKEKEREKEEDREKEEEISTVESIAGNFIPGLGSIVKALEKTSPEFRKKIAETDAEIKHRLETGWSSAPEIKSGISMRPIITGGRSIQRSVIKKQPEEESAQPVEREPIIDVFEEKDYVSVIAEIPGFSEKEIEIKLNDSVLEISAGKYWKEITLPLISGKIIEKQFKNGILQLKIGRKEDAGEDRRS